MALTLQQREQRLADAPYAIYDGKPTNPARVAAAIRDGDVRAALGAAMSATDIDDSPDMVRWTLDKFGVDLPRDAAMDRAIKDAIFTTSEKVPATDRDAWRIAAGQELSNALESRGFPLGDLTGAGTRFVLIHGQNASSLGFGPMLALEEYHAERDAGTISEPYYLAGPFDSEHEANQVNRLHDQGFAIETIEPRDFDAILAGERERVPFSYQAAIADSQRMDAEQEAFLAREHTRNIRPAAGNIIAPDTDALVVPVNLRGAMGAGFAEAVAQRYPEVVEPYRIACRNGSIAVGKPWSFDRGVSTPPRHLVCIATKRDWSDPSRLEDVIAGIEALPAELDRIHARSVTIPGLGTGLGGLDPDVVYPHIERVLGGRDLDVRHAFPARSLDAFAVEAGPDNRPLFDLASPRPPLPPRGHWHDNWFSNMKPFDKPLVEDGIAYPTPEHYFQAKKVARIEDRRRLVGMGPGAAKRASRSMETIPGTHDRAFTDQLMDTALRHKFAPGTNAFAKLVATDRDEIVEWNNWGDRNWGRDISTGQGENRLGIALMQLREEYRARGLRPERPVTNPQRQTSHTQALIPNDWYAGVGTRGISRHEPLYRLATMTANRLERLGYGLRSGAADGADSAFQNGVTNSLAMQIFRPEGEANRSMPPGYYVITGDKAREAERIALRLHPAPEVLRRQDQTYARELHTRNMFQVDGPELDKPAAFLLAIARTIDDNGVPQGGTRTAWLRAQEEGIPCYNLANELQRKTFLEKLTEMESAAGINHKGSILAGKPPTLYVTFPVSTDGIDIANHPPIVIRERAHQDASSGVYVGRTERIAREKGLDHVPELGNPAIVGRDGLAGQCGDKFTDFLGERLAAGARPQVSAMTKLAERAIKDGKLDLICCGSKGCHAHTIAAGLQQRLEDLGFQVFTPNLTEERRLNALPKTKTELDAIERLTERGFDASDVAREKGPWRRAEGDVLAADERYAYVDTGNGRYRRIPQERLAAGQTLATGETVSLAQTQKDLRRLEIADTSTNDQTLAPTTTLAR
jgi:predicted NAD-dependent protein-ADP-ribosyltransferase YbiA (DUF1768 family)/O-acetyl-ADP-ribose deacetylase (regulator of RNase III)